jgi:hypothetical protein
MCQAGIRKNIVLLIRYRIRIDSIKDFQKTQDQTLLMESNNKRQEVILIFLMCITFLLKNEFNKAGAMNFKQAI